MNFYIVCCWEEPLLFTYRSLWVGNMHTFKNYVVYITERPSARGKVKILFYSSWAECLFSQIYKLNIFPSSLIFILVILLCVPGAKIWYFQFSFYTLIYWDTSTTFSFSRFIRFSPNLVYFFKCSLLLAVLQHSTHHSSVTKKTFELLCIKWNLKIQKTILKVYAAY